MYKILVTGAEGQLGKCLKREVKKQHKEHLFLFADKADLDITSQRDVYSFFDKHNISIIVNTAAYTAVDMSEKFRKEAKEVNVLGVINLLKACEEFSVKLVHISTDYVFDGKKSSPYIESDLPSPLNYYGKTKYKAEQLIQKSHINYVILRTSWLFSEYGSNFVNTISNYILRGKELKVVHDQYGKPTYAGDLAVIILKLIDSKLPTNNECYHFANIGKCSWYDFAVAIERAMGINKSKIKAIKTSEYKTLAERPMYSVLNTDKIERKYNIKNRKWQDALIDCLKTIDK